MTYDNERQELEDLYIRAKNELKKSGGKLTVWAGGDAPNQQDMLIESFTTRFPGIKLELRVNLSKYIDIAVYQELLNGSLTPDVVMLQTMNDFEDWKNMGVLELFKPQSFAHLIPGYGDKDGAFLPMNIFAFMPQYAKKGLSTIPKTYKDFLKPVFKNKLVLTPPHDDDAVLYVYDHIIQKYGDDFIHRLAAQKPVFIRGTAAPALLVGTDGFLGNIVGYPTTAAQPSIGFIPNDEPFVSWPQRGAMFKLTRHKAAAKLFLAYITSYEHQSMRGGWSIRDDVKPPRGLKELSSYKNTNPHEFIKWMRNRAHIHDLRQKMQNIFGPVLGESPLTDQNLIRLYYR